MPDKVRDQARADDCFADSDVRYPAKVGLLGGDEVCVLQGLVPGRMRGDYRVVVGIVDEIDG